MTSPYNFSTGEVITETRLDTHTTAITELQAADVLQVARLDALEAENSVSTADIANEAVTRVKLAPAVITEIEGKTDLGHAHVMTDVSDADWAATIHTHSTADLTDADYAATSHSHAIGDVSGVVPAAQGGAGTVTGILKADGLGTVTEMAVGTTAGTVAAGDHTHTGVYVEPSGGVTLIKSGDYLYIRTAWTATHDLVQKIRLTVTPEVPYDNNPINFQSTGLIPVATTDASVPTTAYTTELHTQTDDMKPIGINETNIGANHGCDGVQNVTCVGHGKTAVDIGSVWTDTVGTEFTIMRVVDADNLWVLSENSGTDGNWHWQKSINGNLLTHSAGATHTGNIAISATVGTQLEPAIKNQTRTVYIDGRLVTVDGVYIGSDAEIVHTYDITDVPSLLTFFQAEVGSDPALDDASVDNVARVTATFRYTENGACTVTQSIQSAKALKLTYLGFVQSAKLTIPSGGSLHQYVPKVDSFVENGTTYDFKAIQTITTLADEIHLTAARWTSATAPPERFVQIAKTSGGAKSYGFAIGYCPRLGLGKPASLVAQATETLTISTAGKVYPKAATGASATYADSIVPSGVTFDAVAFRCPVNYTEQPNATNAAWYAVGDDVYLMLDYHAAASEWVSLPERFTGRCIEVIESDGVTVDSAIVSQDGVRVTIAGTYGTAVLRLHNDQSPAYLPVNAPAMTGTATAESLLATGTVSGATATGTTTSAAVVGVASGNGTGVYANAGTGGMALRATGTTGYGVYADTTTGTAVAGSATSGKGAYFASRSNRGAEIAQSGALSAELANNTLHVTRVSTANSCNISGDLIYGNDAPTAAGTRSGNLIRLQKDGADVFKVSLVGLLSTTGGLLTSAAAPAAQTSAGTLGEIRVNTTHAFVCTQTGADGAAHWKRVALDDTAW